MATAAPELLERAHLIDALERSLADAARCRGRLVLVRGEAGGGKTALLRHVAAGAQGARILWGGCTALDTPRPLSPLLEIADAVGGELSAALRGHARLQEIADALFRELGVAPPTMLVLEDVHWADEATLDLLRLLGRRVEPAPALVVASFRDDELGGTHPLQRVLGELASASQVARLEVEPLSIEAVTQLAAGRGADGPELHRKTGGNPFFVTEVLAAGDAAIPDTVREAVLARATRLSEQGRHLLNAVAIVPTEVELWLLETMLDGDLAGLDECIDAGILVHRPGHVAFRHELAREAVQDAVPPHERLLLHRAALRALSEPPLGDPDVARLAHHAEAAGDVAAHVEFARKAGAEAAAFGAHAEAAAHFGRAARHAQALPLEERADLLGRLAYESFLVDDLEVARDAGARLLACQRALGNRIGEADALRELSRLLRFLGRTEDAERAARAAIALLEQEPPGRELSLAYDHYAWLRLIANDNEEAIEWARRAIAIAEESGALTVVAHARLTIGSAEFSLGRPTWRAALEDALALALAVPRDEAAEGRTKARDEIVARALEKLSYAVLHERDLAAASRYLDQGLEHTSTRDLARWRSNLLMTRASLALVRADWNEAIAAAQAALGASILSHARLFALVAAGRARARRGDARVWTTLDEAQELVADADDLDQVGPLAVARAEAHWLAGRADLVVADTERALEAARQRGDPWWLGELAWLRQLAGVEEPLEAGAAEPYRLALEGSWRESSERWRAIGAPFEAAVALTFGGTRESLREALTELERIGAHGATSLVAARLRALGVRAVPRRPRAATRSNPAGLTARELEVLALLATGLQNREIATHLVVSPKTVEHHVSSILRKLEVDTRRDAAAAAPGLGIQ